VVQLLTRFLRRFLQYTPSPADRFLQQELNLPVDAPEVLGSPTVELIPEGGIDPEENKGLDGE
jgi:hypothetical protein